MEYSLANLLSAERFLVKGPGVTHQIEAEDWSLYKSLNYSPPRLVVQILVSGLLMEFDPQTGQSFSGSHVISLPDPLTEIHLVLLPAGEARWFLDQVQAQTYASLLNAQSASVSVLLPFNCK